MLSCAKDIIDTTGGLMGVISDSRSGQFLSGVSVVLSPTGKTYTTGADGKYEFQNVEAQEYSVTASKSGYLSDKKTVTVQAGNTANLDFQLTPSTGHLLLSQRSLDFGNEATTLTFDISNDGAAPLTWELNENATWLSCNPTSGTTQAGEKSSVVATVTRKGLERGNYAQNISVSTNGGSAVINVTMSVQGLMVSVSPEELDFGATTTSMVLNITHNGTGNISYTLTPSNEWIKLSRTTGTFSKTENVTVSVDRTTLSEGDHSGHLTLTVGDDNLQIPVRMNIPKKEKPTVDIHYVSEITHNSAFFKGAVVTVGSSKVTRYGFCWSDTENPTTDSKGVCQLGDTQTAKDYNYTATSLTPSTTYYVRAYAENAEGVSYSVQKKFETLSTPQLAGVETGEVAQIQPTEATVKGSILDLGNTEEITQYGHVWSTRPNPTLSDSKTELGNSQQPLQFQSTMKGLSPNTTYYVRAYATNRVGTSYGKELTFKTSSTIHISGNDYEEEKNWTR